MSRAASQWAFFAAATTGRAHFFAVLLYQVTLTQAGMRECSDEWAIFGPMLILLNGGEGGLNVGGSCLWSCELPTISLKNFCN